MDKPEFRVERGPAATDEAFAIGMAKLLEREGRTIAAAELRRLHELLEAEQALLQRVIYPELQRLRTQRDALLEALKGITPSMPPADAPCHYGIVPQEKCGHCGRIAKARAAIKAVEEGK